MAKLERNAFENLIGTISSIGLGLACVPVLIRVLGVEGFGLTGVLLGLQSICAIVDFGIGATVSHELARCAAAGTPAREQRDLVFTLQAIYWTAALVIGILIFIGAPFIAEHWLKPQQLSVDTVRACLQMMAVAVAVQFPLTFYRCAMLGLNRNGAFNAVFAISAVLRWPGSLVALWLVPGAETYFVAQIVAGAAGTGAAAALLWQCLPTSPAPCSFRGAVVARLWRFSASYSANSIAILVLQRADTVIVSTLLPLDAFGYYSLAQRLASGFGSLIVSVNGATFPHFSAAAARISEPSLAQVYHRGCQIMAVAVAPLAAVSVMFSGEVLLLWTNDTAAAANAQVLLSLLMTGMLIQGVIQGPYYLQVAFGSWRLISWTNTILLATMVPLCILLANRFGGLGAATVSVVVNLGYLFTVPLVHRRLLRGELRRWAIDDVVLPVGGAFGVAVLAAVVQPTDLSPLPGLAYIATTALLATIATAVLAPDLRRSLFPAARHAPQPGIP